jgi:hypothetical protein
MGNSVDTLHSTDLITSTAEETAEAFAPGSLTTQIFTVY